VSDSGSGSRKGGPDAPIRGLVSIRTIGPINPDVGDRHQTSPTEGEIRRRRSEHYSGPRKVDPRIILSYQLKHHIREKPKSRGIHACGVYSAHRRDTRE